MLLLAGCAEVKTHELLPWFKTRTIFHRSIGGLADARTESESYVKGRWGWKKLANCEGGEVLNPDVVALYCSDASNRGTALLRKGEASPRPACGSYAAAALILPTKDAVDCFDASAGRAPVHPTEIAIRRVDLEGRTLMRANLSVDQPGRVFLGRIPLFYGDDATPYFVTCVDDARGAPACALFALKDESLELVATAPELTRGDCYAARAWSQRTGLALRDSLGRPEPKAAALPTSPQKLHIILRD